MDTLKIGRLINSPQERDAVHMAIAPVEAGQKLEPGTFVNLLKGRAFSCFRHSAVGIVDPFLETAVNKGDKFWLLLIPGSITSLRHNWTHPAFPDDLERQYTFTDKQRAEKRAEKRLRDYCELEGVDYEGMLEGYVGDNAGFTLPERLEEDYKIVTGEEVPEYFSCSC